MRAPQCAIAKFLPSCSCEANFCDDSGVAKRWMSSFLMPGKGNFEVAYHACFTPHADAATPRKAPKPSKCKHGSMLTLGNGSCRNTCTKRITVASKPLFEKGGLVLDVH